MDILKVIDKRKHWWKVFVLIFTVSIAVVGYIGHKSYTGAPPLAEFKTEAGETLFREVVEGDVGDPKALGRRLAEALLAAGAGALLRRLGRDAT